MWFNNVNINFDNTFQALEKIDGYLGFYTDLSTFNGAFPNLIEIGGGLDISRCNSVTTLGNAFPKLEKLGSANNYGLSLYLADNPVLTSLGTAFASLRRIPGTIAFGEAVQNFSALDNLECHGGIFVDDTGSDYCSQCPKSLKEMSFCCGKENEMDCDDCGTKTCRGNNVTSVQIENLCLCCQEDLGYKEDGNSWKCANCTELGLNIDMYGYCNPHK